ncbi:MAG: GFA family protein [Pseudomonadota bacterium]
MTTDDRQRGGCQCGTIRYFAPRTPLALYVCHCSECRKQSSSAFGISFTIPRDAFKVEGRPAFWTRKTVSGHTLECAFCRNCGTRLWHQSSGYQETLNVKGGSLDEPVDLGKAIHIWTSSKLPGVIIPDLAICHRREPGDSEP